MDNWMHSVHVYTDNNIEFIDNKEDFLFVILDMFIALPLIMKQA